MESHYLAESHGGTVGYGHDMETNKTGTCAAAVTVSVAHSFDVHAETAEASNQKDSPSIIVSKDSHDQKELDPT